MLLPHIPEKLLKRDKNQFGRYCTAFSSWRGALLSLSVYLSVCLSSLYQHLSFYLSFLSHILLHDPDRIIAVSSYFFPPFFTLFWLPSFSPPTSVFSLFSVNFGARGKTFLDSRTLRLRHVLSTANNSLVQTKHTQKKANCESWQESRDELW